MVYVIFSTVCGHPVEKDRREGADFAHFAARQTCKGFIYRQFRVGEECIPVIHRPDDISVMPVDLW